MVKVTMVTDQNKVSSIRDYFGTLAFLGALWEFGV
jgi:hypothetical protein